MSSEQVFRALAESPEPMTALEVMRGLGLRFEQTYAALVHLEARGDAEIVIDFPHSGSHGVRRWRSSVQGDRRMKQGGWH